MEKISLPIKTKIAAWWMIGLLSVFSLFIGLKGIGIIVDLLPSTRDALGYLGIFIIGGGIFAMVFFSPLFVVA